MCTEYTKLGQVLSLGVFSIRKRHTYSLTQHYDLTLSHHGIITWINLYGLVYLYRLFIRTAISGQKTCLHLKIIRRPNTITPRCYHLYQLVRVGVFVQALYAGTHKAAGHASSEGDHKRPGISHCTVGQEQEEGHREQGKA